METPIILDASTVHDGKFLQMKTLTLAHPNGETSAYEMVSRKRERVFGIVSILPITQDGNIIMIRQYRAPLDRVQLELPSGCAEVGKHASLEDAVHAELREETGYASENIQHIAELSSSSGMTNETVHGYIAENCHRVSDILELDHDEYIERVMVPYTEFDQFILSEMARGAIIEPKMIAMIYIWRSMLAKA